MKIIKFNLFDKKLIKLFFGNGSAEFIQFAIAPIIARIYTPKEFAYFVICMTLSDIILSFCSLKFEIGINKFFKENKNYLLVSISSSFIITTILSFIILLVSLVFFQGSFNYTNVSYWLSIYLLVNIFNIYRSTELYFISETRYKKVVKAKVISKFVINISQVLFSFFGKFGLIIGRLVGLVVGIFTFKINMFSFNDVFSKNTIKKTINLFKRNKKTQTYLLLSSTTRQLLQNSNKIIIPLLYNDIILGVYGWAYNYTLAPLGIIMKSISDTLFEDLSKYRKKAVMFRTLMLQLLIGGPFFLILYFFGFEIFQFIFGQQWSESGKIAQILSPYLFMTFMTSPNVSIYYVLDKEENLFKFDIWNLISSVVAFISGYLLFSTFEKSLEFFVIVGVLNYSYLLIKILITSRKCLN